MAEAGYESDRPRIMVLNRATGKAVEWSKGYEGHPTELAWAPTSKTLYFAAPHQGHQELFSATEQAIQPVTQGRYLQSIQVTPDQGSLIFLDEAADRPPEVYRWKVGGQQVQALTHFNAELKKTRHFQAAEHHWFKGAEEARVHAVLLKPPGFRQGTRYPAVVIIHGGPQGMTGDSFHPRWNLQMFAAQGYVVFGINFHGSIGFGQPFTNAIRGDWGGKPYEDVLKGTEYLARLPFVKPRHICAAGASYGGYLVNWIGTQSRRFKCLISHAGLYNLESKYGSTEELWFPEWEFRGTPWTNRTLYQKLSPHSYAENLKTPMLVIHGQNDYRVPVEQGLQLFTVLKRQGTPARLLYFPDEDHFVQKPLNVMLWWQTMQQWLSRYL
jgi:dipeptidyl aminopeptidase/acylaminoacyl peptidase